MTHNLYLNGKLEYQISNIKTRTKNLKTKNQNLNFTYQMIHNYTWTVKLEYQISNIFVLVELTSNIVNMLTYAYNPAISAIPYYSMLAS